ncbi:MAG: nicotinate (nicotinamide) nucleotide adenylyltransferase [Phycisphaera sp. RhM]|nr:nicotinate (nicotinamide) nucleotide adenylyltransferase [Phycisphaera sp. RhM]
MTHRIPEMRIGVFGGSFDPVHVGHLWIAEAATESLGLDRLLWIPTATQPLKPGGPVATNEQRVEMLRLAIAGRPGHDVDQRELHRAGVSYTVDSIAELEREHVGAELFLIIGSDSLASMRRWHQPEELLSRVTLAVVRRGGEGEIDFSVLDGLVGEERIERFRRCVIEMPLIEISSSEIRDRAGQGSSIRHRVPRPVEVYIEANGVYRK